MSIEKKMQSLGRLLTFLLTLPILGFLFFGVTGGVIGLVVGGLLAVGSIGAEMQKKDKAQ
jgi:predicted benzoate:H+ symporter BenE